MTFKKCEMEKKGNWLNVETVTFATIIAILEKKMLPGLHSHVACGITITMQEH